MFRIESTRGGVVESVHRVSVAVVDSVGRRVASAGNPELVTFWRSAAKPFQAMPLADDGVADRFGFGAEELALACASHSSEPEHRALAARMLGAVGLGEEALACGPHPPLSPEVAEQVIREGVTMTPLWSNCSGKHAGMLALAVLRGWPVTGYERPDHPVQARVLREVERWTDVPAATLVLGQDGCTVVSFGLPLVAMALAYARFGVSGEPAAVRIRRAMAEHPWVTAGSARLETAGAAIVKIGADGVYCAALPAAGLGVALKVEDGAMECLGPALLAVLRLLARVRPIGLEPERLPIQVTRHGDRAILNTRGLATGRFQAAGELRFHD
jgi:L-asparaginase II